MSCEDCKDKSSCGSCSATDQESQMKKQDYRIQAFLDRVKHKLVVMSGKGGVGKTTVAVNTALLLSEHGYKVGLLDVDLHGPSVAGLLGLRNLPLMADGETMVPYQYSDNLQVMTVQGLLSNQDAALVWRGPVKIGIIRQFLADTKWGDLDYLIIDCPPGTGDEPLTVIQTIPDVEAVIITTPQAIALDDVRKSISFCELAKVKVLGLVENMSGFLCPNCQTVHNIFKSGGGEKLAQDKGLAFLGKIPLDPSIVAGDDDAEPLDKLTPIIKASFTNIVTAIEKAVEN